MQKSPSPKASAFLRRVSAVSATAVVLYGMSLQTTSAAISWDGGAGTTSWWDAGNWNTDALPNSSSGEVTIGNQALVIAGAGTAALGSSGAITLLAALLWKCRLARLFLRAIPLA